MNPDDPITLGLTEHPAVDGSIDSIRAEIAVAQTSKRKRFASKLFIAALSSIPWIGGYISAAASFQAEESTVRENELQNDWLEEHHKKLVLLHETLAEVDHRFESIGPEIEERIESEEYLGLVRKAFRIWDNADTEEKRRYVANVVTNAGGTRVCSDDLLRLFLDWLAILHESHFAVIRKISVNPGSTRMEVWSEIYDRDVTEDSAEADLFKLLFRDLSTGGVIRQERDTDALGRFRTKRRVHVPRGAGSATMKSAFDDKEAYVLTAMGKQFVHYTMNEVILRITEKSAPDDSTAEQGEP